MSLALTPPMGWNSWNTFGGDIDEALFLESAQAMLDQGLLAAGYEFVNMDDCWHGCARDLDGRLTWDTAKFPRGIKTVADEVHKLGFKFGTYTCAGTHTCAGYPSSLGYEQIDAHTFADWGVDYLKVDFCNRPLGVDGIQLYTRMGQALRQTGRPIVFSVCEWGLQKPWLWAGSRAGAHLWRTTGDIVDSWESIKQLGFVEQKGLEKYAGPGRWNDPDMLVVGMYNKGNSIAGGCTDTEYRSHFALWCLLAAPLLIGCDVRSMTPQTKAILTAKEVIAVNQDPLGAQGTFLDGSHERDTGQEEAEMMGRKLYPWQTIVKPLADGSWAVGMFNLQDEGSHLGQVAWETLGLNPHDRCIVRDLWAGEDIGEFRSMYSARIEAHAHVLVKVTPIKAV